MGTIPKPETFDVLSDDDSIADLRQSRKDFAADDTFDAAQVQAELKRFWSDAT